MSPSISFSAILPQQIKVGDKIILKGRVRDDADEFSINFPTDTCQSSCTIAYHLKTIFDLNLVVENCKYQGQWMKETIKENNWIDGQGSGFEIEFLFQDNSIYTYFVEDESRNLISNFEHVVDFKDIKSLQVWGDLDKISELTFMYA